MAHRLNFANGGPGRDLSLSNDEEQVELLHRIRAFAHPRYRAITGSEGDTERTVLYGILLEVQTSP
jgi:hypothetical protein